MEWLPPDSRSFHFNSILYMGLIHYRLRHFISHHMWHQKYQLQMRKWNEAEQHADRCQPMLAHAMPCLCVAHTFSLSCTYEVCIYRVFVYPNAPNPKRGPSQLCRATTKSAQWLFKSEIISRYITLRLFNLYTKSINHITSHSQFNTLRDFNNQHGTQRVY